MSTFAPTTPANRLIVSLDPKPNQSFEPVSLEKQIETFARSLEGMGVCIKLNSFLRIFGFGLIRQFREEYGLEVFADLKLYDTYPTMEHDAHLLALTKPKFLTVHTLSSVPSMRRVQELLPDTNVLGVTILTEQDSDYTQATFMCSLQDGVLRLAHRADLAELDGIIAAPAEIPLLRQAYGDLSIVTPNVRPAWAKVQHDNQNQARAMTPHDAIVAGAERIIVGRPITQAKDPRAAVERILEEIEEATKLLVC